VNEEVRFDRLNDVELRHAWPHEANDFTPWLAQNIDHIAEAVGRPLELTGTEVLVGTYYADILARNLQDDSVVLIENQLEQTDHTHLGQIMTYLAGLDAQTVIWIAPSFREPHRSAIRWLNQHTGAAGFSFFALRLRVVRIGDSPFAPMFEVVEKPNNWERVLHAKVEAAEGDIGRRREAFWTAYLERYPDAAERGLAVCRHSNIWLPAPPEGTILGLYIAGRSCGVYVRGPSRSVFEDVLARFAPCREALEARLGVPLNEAGSDWLLVSKLDVPLSEQARWPQMIDFMEERSKHYFATLTDIFGSDPK
jgi:hypothetical protein